MNNGKRKPLLEGKGVRLSQCAETLANFGLVRRRRVLVRVSKGGRSYLKFLQGIVEVMKPCLGEERCLEKVNTPHLGGHRGDVRCMEAASARNKER